MKQMCVIKNNKITQEPLAKDVRRLTNEGVGIWEVRSSKHQQLWYKVVLDLKNNKISCGCPAWKYHSCEGVCKHMLSWRQKTKSRGQKVFVTICAVFIVLLIMVVAGNISQMNKGEDRLEELYQNCIDENDDIMSYGDAVETCDQALEDGNTFG